MKTAEELDVLRIERILRDTSVREERRARLQALNFDPDAYPRTQDSCAHAWHRPNGDCFACGFNRGNQG